MEYIRDKILLLVLHACILRIDSDLLDSYTGAVDLVRILRQEAVFPRIRGNCGADGSEIPAGGTDAGISQA